MSDNNKLLTSNMPNEDQPRAAIVPRVTTGFANSEPVAEVSFAELWRIMRKRKWIVAAWTCGFFALGLVYCLICTPKYESTSTIQFNKENSDTLAPEDPRGMIGDATGMDYHLTQQTQVDTLKSDTLALQVIHDLKLENRPEFSPKPLWDAFTKHPDESQLPLEKAPHRRATVLKVYHKNLRVDVVDGTRIIKISFLSPAPEVAAAVVNSLVSNYQEEQFRTRFAATAEVSDRLSKQLDDLKNQVAASQEALVRYQKQAGILGVDETHNIVMTRLEEADKAVVAAQGEPDSRASHLAVGQEWESGVDFGFGGHVVHNQVADQSELAVVDPEPAHPAKPAQGRVRANGSHIWISQPEAQANAE